ncbi:hypothetical protein B0J14DRAFT_568734 [Halenospora varia]|nr:hypothetical protein B0J14DRAFT_568734 [Halenospora varia]
MVLWNPAGRIREQGNLRRSRSSAARLTGLGISTSSTTISSSRQKRKRDKGFVDGKSGKRTKSIGKRGNHPWDAEKSEPGTTGHHSIQEAEPDSLEGREGDLHLSSVMDPARYAGQACLAGALSSPVEG